MRGATRPCGHHLLTWSEDGTLRRWDLRVDRIDEVFEGHDGPVTWVEVFDDGRALSWSDDHTARLWDVAAGSSLAVLRGHEGALFGARLLDDGAAITWSADGTGRRWDAATGAPLAVMRGHTAGVRVVVALADGRLLSLSEDGHARRWSPDGVASEAGPCDAADALALADGRVVTWSVARASLEVRGLDGAVLATLQNRERPLRGVCALGPDALLSWGDDETTRWSLVDLGACERWSWDEIRRAEPALHRTRVARERRGAFCAGRYAEGVVGGVRVRDAATSREVERFEAPGAWTAFGLHDDGAVVAGRGHQVAIFRPRRGDP